MLKKATKFFSPKHKSIASCVKAPQQEKVSSSQWSKPKLKKKKQLNAAATFSALSSHLHNRFSNLHLVLWGLPAWALTLKTTEEDIWQWDMTHRKLSSTDVPVHSLSHRKKMTDYLVSQGLVRDGGSAQYGGFRTIGVPLAIEAIKDLFGKGMHVDPLPPPVSRVRRSPSGSGMHINPYWAQVQSPPPFFGTWGKNKLSSKTFLFQTLTCWNGANSSIFP